MTAPVAVGHPDMCSVCFRAVQRVYWFGLWEVCERHSSELEERWYHKDRFGVSPTATEREEAAARARLVDQLRREVHGVS